MTFSAIKEKISTLGNGSVFAAIVIVVLGLSLGVPMINAFPAYIHAWAQADWYSIALGFHNNGFDFFHPETFIYNKQFPGWWAFDCGDTVTSVDLPIHTYIVALLMSLFGTTAPWVFRGWTLLCSLAGTWFLYLLCRRLTQSNIKSLAVVVVYMTTPVYAYYMANFLPSTPSMALVLAGMWAYVCHRQEGRQWQWHLAVALLALAALMRTSQLVVLVAVCGFEMLCLLRREDRIRLKWLSVIVAFAAIAAYYLWNQHLIKLHGTLFLNSLMPPKNWDDVDFITGYIQLYWKWKYFSQLQHWIIAIALAAALVFTIWRAVSKKKQTGADAKLSLWWLAAIWWLGETCFFVAMMRQYVDHDYYFLDSLFLPSIFLFVLALKALPEVKGDLVALLCTATLVTLGCIMYNNAHHNNRGRCQSDDRAYQCYENYKDSDRWLDSIGVSRDARLLSIYSYPQNTPFILMGRKGYTMMWHDDNVVESAMYFPFDYAVIEDTMFRENFDEHRDFLGRLERLNGNGRLSLCRLSDTAVNNSIDDFFNK